MTVEELEIELGCYKLYLNEGCDIHNLTKEEWAEFITIRDALPELYEVVAMEAPILRMFE